MDDAVSSHATKITRCDCRYVCMSSAVHILYICCKGYIRWDVWRSMVIYGMCTDADSRDQSDTFYLLDCAHGCCSSTAPRGCLMVIHGLEQGIMYAEPDNGKATSQLHRLDSQSITMRQAFPKNLHTSGGSQWTPRILSYYVSSVSLAQRPYVLNLERRSAPMAPAALLSRQT